MTSQQARYMICCHTVPARYLGGSNSASGRQSAPKHFRATHRDGDLGSTLAHAPSTSSINSYTIITFPSMIIESQSPILSLPDKIRIGTLMVRNHLSFNENH